MASKSPAPRYSIGEWFGASAADASPADRRRLAAAAVHRCPGMRCPFAGGDATCSKKGGVCSLRLYSRGGDGDAVPAGDEICTVCPRRFHEAGTVFEWIGEELLGTRDVVRISEVDFLLTENNTKAGRIDVVLCDPRSAVDGSSLRWCAVEMQAVYFSGAAMTEEFNGVAEAHGALIPFPRTARRPDYRSSSSKRLQPQLDTKCHILRTWGKKTAVVVDRRFFNSLRPMQRAIDIDGGDVIWFIVDYRLHGGRYVLVPDETMPVTLDDARRGLRNAEPVRRVDFEEVLRARMDA